MMITFENDGSITPIAESDRDWALFFLFGVTVLHADPISFEQHIDWIRGHAVQSPDDWLGDEGERFRARFKWRNPSNEFICRWRDCLRINKDLSLAELRERIELIVMDAEGDA
jgi:hypothetical protein